MERLTTSKLIRDLSGRPREPFFGPEWQERNKQDILLAREQTRKANEAAAPRLLMQMEAPEDTECDYELERTEIEEDFDDGTKEAWENYLNRD